MNIFGIKSVSKKELKKRVAVLEAENEALYSELDGVAKDFPFDMGQKVYDIALKNNKGRYTKTKPSREYSTITEVEVTEKNYFSLVKRLNNCDVFLSQEDAESYLDHVCK